MRRKRRQPTPYFNQPPSFNPMTGQHAPLQGLGITPYCTLMQVAAEDDKNDYVICRGWDPRNGRFYDYDADDPTSKPGISVAKPYGRRSAGIYTIGQVFPAFLPLYRFGQNPGTTGTTGDGGHPNDLDEAVVLLQEEPPSGIYIDWMLVGDGSGRIPFELAAALTPGGTVAAYPRPIVAGEYVTDTDADTFQVTDTLEIYRGRIYNEDRPGSLGYCQFNPDLGVFEIVELQPMVLEFEAAVNMAAGLDTGDANITIDGAVIMQPIGGIWLTDDGNAPTTVVNAFSWDADDDAMVFAQWHEHTEDYVAYQVEC